ncbi:hypothetical protein BJ138DRAFT_1115885 [Hygrophoropsis aurantiaca]|uniref:Uncharacterized protein n=1 Tax=Hygrophoropsis aurantiaca TaxID=72124 RepID=A0ACB8A5N8_9AGAM|nr:hypothetical protein BJ138DRAFT_1115885 [Hygrophoropsis aurantiaca]
MSTQAVIMAKFDTYLQFCLTSAFIEVFDYCITFSTEITWTWNRPWNFVRVQLSLARYLPFIIVPMTIYDSLNPGFVANCWPLVETISWLINIVIVPAENLLLVRTWVLWRRKKAVLVGLLVPALGSVIVAVIMNVIAVRATIYKHRPPSNSSCSEAFRPSSIYVWSFLGVVIFELIILLATVFQISHYDRQSRIYVTIRNDVVYILCILGISVANAIIVKTRGGNAEPVIILQVVIHSVLASRLLFSLRQIMQQQNTLPSGVSIAQSSANVDVLPIVFVTSPEGSVI